MNKKHLSALVIIFAFILSINACKKDKAEGTDKELLDMSKTTSGFTWYKNSNTLLSKSSGSGHPEALLRTRYNSTAATMLDSLGKVMANATFPEGSLVVKELYDNATSLSRYAILYKQTNHVDADARGWVWGYINEDGSVAEPASKKGSACISCHLQSDNIDYMLMNKFFP